MNQQLGTKAYKPWKKDQDGNRSPKRIHINEVDNAEGIKNDLRKKISGDQYSNSDNDQGGLSNVKTKKKSSSWSSTPKPKSSLNNGYVFCILISCIVGCILFAVGVNLSNLTDITADEKAANNFIEKMNGGNCFWLVPKQAPKTFIAKHRAMHNMKSQVYQFKPCEYYTYKLPDEKVRETDPVWKLLTDKFQTKYTTTWNNCYFYKDMSPDKAKSWVLLDTKNIQCGLATKLAEYQTSTGL